MIVFEGSHINVELYSIAVSLSLTVNCYGGMLAGDTG